MIPGSTTFVTSSHSVHMDPDYWSHPETFLPERFLDQQVRYYEAIIFLSFSLSLFRSFTLSLFLSFTLSLFHSFTLLLFYSFTLLLFHSISLSLSFSLSFEQIYKIMEQSFVPVIFSFRCFIWIQIKKLKKAELGIKHLFQNANI